MRDSATLLDATAGADEGAPYWAPPTARPFRDEIGAPPAPLRIGFTTTAPTGAAIDPDCVAAVRDAATLCASLGHHVDEISLPISGEMLLLVWPVQLYRLLRTVCAAISSHQAGALTFWAIYSAQYATTNPRLLRFTLPRAGFEL